MAVWALATGLLAQAGAPPGEQPAISNAKLDSASAAGGLEAAVRGAIGKQTTPAWIGYVVPKVAGEGQSCCWDNGDRGCPSRRNAVPDRWPRRAGRSSWRAPPT